MTYYKKILIGILFLGMVLVAWRVLFPGDETRIRRQLSRMGEVVSYEADASPLAGIAAASRFVKFLTPEVSVSIRIPGVGHRDFQGRENLREAFLASRSPRTGLSVVFLDPRIQLENDSQARVEVTVKVTQPGNPEIQAQALRIDFVRYEGDWMVSGVETIETIGR